jgi:hypothetical protein
MERFEIELLAAGEIPERVRAVGHFVASFAAWIKPEDGNANGPIKSSRNPPSGSPPRPGLQTPDAFQHILVQIAPRAKAVLAEFLVWYLNNCKLNIKISKGTTTIEVPSGSVSLGQMKEILDSM